MKLFVFSHAMHNRHAYTSLREYISLKYSDSEYMFVAIEDINVAISADTLTFSATDRSLPLDAIPVIYLIDLGHIDLTSLSYRIYLLKELERRGIKVINSPETILVCRNKLATYFRLQEARLPIIPTRSDLRELSNSGMRLLKPLLGTSGIGIVPLPPDDASVTALLPEWENTHGAPPLVQPILPKNANSDIRALVLGDRVLASMRRLAPEGSLVTNILRGGIPAPYRLTAEMEQIALSAANAVSGEVVTVDLLETPDGEIYLLEVNGFARWHALQGVTDFPIHQAVADYIMSM